MTAQIIEISGKKIAMLPAEEYQLLLEKLEDHEDIRAAERAEKRRLAGEEYVPFSLVNSIIDGENALRAWRKYRNMTLQQLADAAGARHATLSLIENGKAQGKPALWRALAEALNVAVDDILPDD